MWPGPCALAECLLVLTLMSILKPELAPRVADTEHDGAADPFRRF
jgi:hypothetical protein